MLNEKPSFEAVISAAQNRANSLRPINGRRVSKGNDSAMHPQYIAKELDKFYQALECHIELTKRLRSNSYTRLNK